MNIDLARIAPEMLEENKMIKVNLKVHLKWRIYYLLVFDELL